MPTPVGPPGPDELDPNDPDLWSFEADDELVSTRLPTWVKVTAVIVAIAFLVAVFAGVVL